MEHLMVLIILKAFINCLIVYIERSKKQIEF